MTKAIITIEETEDLDANGDPVVNIRCDLEPDISEDQREGFEELPYTHALAGAVLQAIQISMVEGD